MPKRCALGCSNKTSYHHFPHPEKNPDRFKAWVHIAGGKLDTPADYELYRKKVICDIHFTDRDRNRNNRLNFLAVPSLHLSGKSDEVGTSKNVLLPSEPVNEESSLATLKLTITDKQQPQELLSFLLDQLITARRKVKILQCNLIRSQKKNKMLQSRIASAEKRLQKCYLKN